MKTAAAPSLLLFAIVAAVMVVLPAAPGHALEKKVVGDVTVEEGEVVEQVHTAWGDVVVEGEVEEDVSSGFGDIQVRGPVGGDVEAGFGSVRVDAPVAGDIDVGHGDLHLGSGARIGGEISHGSGRIFREEGAVVTEGAVGMASDFDEDSPWEAFSGAIGWGVMTLVLAAAAVLVSVVAPGTLRASARSLEGAPVRSLLVGVGSLPAMLIASVLLFFTGVGIVLLVLAWPAYLVLVIFGALVAAYSIGRKIVLTTGRYRAGDAIAAVVGALLVSVAYLIPFVGGVLFAALAFLGTGGAVLAFFMRRRPRNPRRPTYASYEEYLRARRDA